MKKTILLAVAFLLTISSTTFAQKIGYCNSVMLLQEMPEVKQADSDLQAYQAQLTKRGQEMVQQLQAKDNELQKKKADGTISPKDYEDQAAKLLAEQEIIKNYEQEVYEKLGKKREELYQPILDKVNKAMSEVAKVEGYLIVLDSSQQVILYADETLDLTKAVKAKLGITN